MRAEEGRSGGPRAPAGDARPGLLRHRAAGQGIAVSQPFFRMSIPALAPRAAGTESQADQSSLEEGWQSRPMFWPGEPRGQRNLEGCSPWDHKEPGTTA